MTRPPHLAGLGSVELGFFLTWGFQGTKTFNYSWKEFNKDPPGQWSPTFLELSYVPSTKFHVLHMYSHDLSAL